MRCRAIWLFWSVVIVLGLWAFIFEPGFRHHTKTYKIQIKNWLLGKYKVVVLADLHIGSPFNDLSRLEKIVHLVNEQKPDLILITGDLVIHEVLGGTFVEPALMIPALKKLKASEGVYAVLGNHDHWLDADVVTKAIETAGITVLTNRERYLNGYWLVGVDDCWAGTPDLKNALNKITSDEPVILFTHNPDLFVDIPDRVGLTIAGHTHGGQVYIPFIGRPIVPSEYGERFAIGHVIEGTKQIFISPGTGTSILPVRFLVPPEISIIEYI